MQQKILQYIRARSWKYSLQDESEALSITHRIICTSWGQKLHGYDQAVLTVMCFTVHLWNCLKLVSKGHCWGWHLLPLLIQHHGRTLPEESVLNSSLTLAACREVSSPHYLDFVIWQPVLLHFKFSHVYFSENCSFQTCPRNLLTSG